MITKRELRLQLRALQSEFLASGESARESERILSQLEAMEVFQKASCVLAYMALKGEVETAEFLAKWAKNKRMVIPKVVGDELELRLYDPNCLVEGYAGILEPSGEALIVPPTEIQLALVPGLAFARDTQRPDLVWRMGRGKGFYDRFLPSLNCPVYGVAFPFRVVPELPLDPWDKPLGGLIV